jgi:hypothetical protein
MLQLATTIALASLSLAVIQPMGAAGAKVNGNSSSPGPAMQYVALGLHLVCVADV